MPDWLENKNTSTTPLNQLQMILIMTDLMHSTCVAGGTCRYKCNFALISFLWLLLQLFSAAKFGITIINNINSWYIDENIPKLLKHLYHKNTEL